MGKLSMYNSIIRTLQNNDKNATYEDILENVEYDLESAIKVLYNCLSWLVNDEGLEGEELKFYENQLERVKGIKGGY